MEPLPKKKPVSGFSSSSRDVQLAALKEWEDRTGQTSSSAEIILVDRKKPLTMENFMVENDRGVSVEDALMDPDYLESIPEWFVDLPLG